MIKKILEEKRKEKKKEEVIDTAKKIAGGAAVGTTIGALTGVLFAPKSGKETREDIVGKNKELIEKGKKKIEDITKSSSEEDKSK